MHNLAPFQEIVMHHFLWDFNIQTDRLIPARRPDLIIINRKKRICKIVDFTVPADHRINLKESEKKDKYLNLARELKKAVKVTIVPIVIGALGIITKGLLKGLEDLEIGGRVETIQTTALPRTARILRRVLGLEETCCHSNFSEKPSVNTDVKNSKAVNYNNIRPFNYQRKKRTCKIVNVAVSADHILKLKDCEKKDKYFDLAREWKNYGTER